MEEKVKHIILGAGGVIGNVLTKELSVNNEKIKLVSRSAKTFNGIETAKADLTKYDEVKTVIEESSTVYVTAGLAYDIKVWRTDWPKIMRNTIDACKAKNASLIFFDNVYSYGKVAGAMTEETPFNPCSKKGEVRAKIAEDLLAEIKSNNLKASIARAADFYGPYSEKSSVPFILVISNLAKGKKAQWISNAETKHSFTHIPDCGKALYLLAKADDSYNQVWHLPTAHPPITGEEFIRLVAERMGVRANYNVLKGWMIKLAGIFNTQIGELYEMLYQNKFDYIFDSSKFEKKFNFIPTPYESGIDETIKEFRRTVNN